MIKMSSRQAAALLLAAGVETGAALPPAADAVSKWTKAVTDAAIAACKEKKNPLNAALAVVAKGDF